MIRLRVSTIDAFRRVVATDFGDEAELADTLIRGQWADGPANLHMQVGTAFHAILARDHAAACRREYHGDSCAAFFRSGDFAFDEAHVREALAHVGPGLTEVTGHRLFNVGGLPVQVQGTCDRIHGLAIRDAKCKFTPVDARDYEHSLQWRFYLLLHKAAWFTYDLFSFKDPDQFGVCKLREITSFRFWPYPGLEDECRGWLARLLDWAQRRGLLGHLERDRPPPVLASGPPG